MKNLTVAQRKQLKETLADAYATFHKDGTVTVRNSFYWRADGGAARLEERINICLQRNGFSAQAIDCGTQFAAFRGGDDTQKGQGSFYWVKYSNFTVLTTEATQTNAV